MLLRSKRIRKALISILIAFVTAAPALSYALPVQCECVRYLREALGVNIRGDAWTIQPNVPFDLIEPGDVILLQYGKVSHAALVTNIDDTIHIAESNFYSCSPSTRELAITDTHIRGVYRPLSPLS